MIQRHHHLENRAEWSHKGFPFWETCCYPRSLNTYLRTTSAFRDAHFSIEWCVSYRFVVTLTRLCVHDTSGFI